MKTYEICKYDRSIHQFEWKPLAGKFVENFAMKLSFKWLRNSFKYGYPRRAWLIYTTEDYLPIKKTYIFWGHLKKKHFKK